MEGETWVQLCTRLQTRLKYYLESREVGQSYERLCELLVADKLKSVIPNALHDFIRQRELGGWMAPQELAKNVDTYVADRNTGVGGGDQGERLETWWAETRPTASLSLVEVKDSRDVELVVEEEVVEPELDEELEAEVVDVVAVEVVETLARLAPTARSAIVEVTLGPVFSSPEPQPGSAPSQQQQQNQHAPSSTRRVDRVSAESSCVCVCAGGNCPSDTEVKKVDRVTTPLCANKQSVACEVRECESRGNIVILLLRVCRL